MPLPRTTKIKRAVRKLLLTPMQPFWAWNQTPKQRNHSLRIRLWVYGVAIIIGTAIYYPFLSLAILASIVCGVVIAFFLGRHNNPELEELGGEADHEGT